MGKHATLYDDDFLSWTELQAAELRKLAARPELSNAMDWDNLIEEVESLGRGELSGVKSKLVRALEHLIKAYCDSQSRSKDGWATEVTYFLAEAREDYRPSMKQRFTVDELWQKAARSAFEVLRIYNIHIPPGIPSVCPFTVEQLVDERMTFQIALDHLSVTKGGNAPFEFRSDTFQ